LKLPLRVPGLRTQVLLLALVLFAIPWVGYRYILEMERFLREGQERALVATARAVATALHVRAALFETGGAAPCTARSDSSGWRRLGLAFPVRSLGRLAAYLLWRDRLDDSAARQA
jgi:two-component system sensor histidine kinase ChvG